VRVGFRSANYDTPLWVNPDRMPYRFNAPEEAPTQYLALHPLGCVAEYLRGNDLQTPESLNERVLRVWALKLEIDGAGVLSFDSADSHGLQAHDLISDDYGPCQDWATAIRKNSDAPNTWIVPSAALPGTENVVIFGPRVMSSFDLQPEDPGIEIPATVVADVAMLHPDYLIPFVRFRGLDHWAFEAWSQGEPYAFLDPPHYPLTW
jgi:hypothetical protein